MCVVCEEKRGERDGENRDRLPEAQKRAEEGKRER